ncbi:MAG: hypothetical protein GON13_03130 [Nanoarchaeota archaeon]|nr:hypothetical protein [Nanoarchaeota archaeon]
MSFAEYLVGLRKVIVSSEGNREKTEEYIQKNENELGNEFKNFSKDSGYKPSSLSRFFLNFKKKLRRPFFNKKNFGRVLSASLIENLTTPTFHELGHGIVMNLNMDSVKSANNYEIDGVTSKADISDEIKYNIIYKDLYLAIKDGDHERFKEFMQKLSGLGVRGTAGFDGEIYSINDFGSVTKHTIQKLESDVYHNNLISYQRPGETTGKEGTNTTTYKFSELIDNSKIITVNGEEVFSQNFKKNTYALVDEDNNVYFFDKEDYDKLIELDPELQDNFLQPGTNMYYSRDNDELHFIKNNVEINIDQVNLNSSVFLGTLEEYYGNLDSEYTAELKRHLKEQLDSRLPDIFSGPFFQELWILFLVFLAFRLHNSNVNWSSRLKDTIIFSEIRRLGYSLISINSSDYNFFSRYLSESFSLNFEQALLAVWVMSFSISFSIIKLLGRINNFESIVPDDGLSMYLYSLSKKTVDEMSAKLVHDYGDKCLSIISHKKEDVLSVVERHVHSFFDVFTDIQLELELLILPTNYDVKNIRKRIKRLKKLSRKLERQLNKTARIISKIQKSDLKNEKNVILSGSSSLSFLKKYLSADSLFDKKLFKKYSDLSEEMYDYYSKLWDSNNWFEKFLGHIVTRWLELDPQIFLDQKNEEKLVHRTSNDKHIFKDHRLVSEFELFTRFYFDLYKEHKLFDFISCLISFARNPDDPKKSDSVFSELLNITLSEDGASSDMSVKLEIFINLLAYYTNRENF